MRRALTLDYLQSDEFWRSKHRELQAHIRAHQSSPASVGIPLWSKSKAGTSRWMHRISGIGLPLQVTSIHSSSICVARWLHLSVGESCGTGSKTSKRLRIPWMNNPNILMSRMLCPQRRNGRRTSYFCSVVSGRICVHEHSLFTNIDSSLLNTVFAVLSFRPARLLVVDSENLEPDRAYPSALVRSRKL